jgi:hypothetical protein
VPKGLQKQKSVDELMALGYTRQEAEAFAKPGWDRDTRRGAILVAVMVAALLVLILGQ